MELKDLFRRFLMILFFVLLAFLPAMSLFALEEVPVLSRPVMDTAGIVDEATQTELDGLIRQLYDETGIQIAVLTVPSIGEESIEDFSMRVARAWKLGTKDADSGLLITLALAEHKVRIEVGYGLEGTLTDTKCGLIIRNIMTPAFKNDDYSSGIREGVEALTGLLRGDEDLNARLEKYAEEGSGSANLWIPFLMLFFFAGVAIPDSLGAGPFACFWFKAILTGKPFVRRKRVLKSTSSGSSLSGGEGSSISSSSDSSYSGGGGDFGGGGSSGQW